MNNKFEPNLAIETKKKLWYNVHYRLEAVYV